MKQSRSRPPQSSIVDRMRTTVRGYMLRGLLVLVPLGVTAYALILVYRLTAANLAPYVNVSRLPVAIPAYLVDAAVVVLSAVLFVTMLYLIGLATAVVIGRWFIGMGEAILHRIPLVKSVYAASKQAIDLLQPKEDESPTYQEAVIVDFPGPGIKSIAFVVGRTQIEDRGEHYRVFIPTTPNPTSGYLELYPAHMVQHSTMTVEEAIKSVMSAGILVPDVIHTTAHSTASVSKDVATGESATSTASASPAKHDSLLQGTKHLLRRRILSGFLVLVPLAITVFVVKFLYDFTAGRIEPLTSKLIAPLSRYVPEFAAPVVGAIVSILLLLVALYVTGYIATAVVGGRMIRLGEAILNRIPLVATVYSASKQIIETLLFKKGGSGFQDAVIVEFPYPGVYCGGFLVGRSQTADGEPYCRVFVPTAPNISVGLLQLFSPDKTYKTVLTVEETVKMVVSCGLIAPDELTFKPLSQAESIEEIVVVEG